VSVMSRPGIHQSQIGAHQAVLAILGTVIISRFAVHYISITFINSYYYYYYYYYYYFLWLCSAAQAMASSFTRFLDHTQRRATVGRTLLDE
jgi:hypothetical protein